MYWFRVWKLEEDFREGRVDERERFKYYLATLIAWSVVVYALIFSGTVFDVENLVSAGINLIVIVVGTVLCYRANRRGDDKDFIPRMICLGWPVTVKVTLGVLAVFFLWACLTASPWAAISGEAFVAKIPFFFRKLWPYFWGIYFLWPYFWLLHGSLARIARTREVPSVAEAGNQSLETLLVDLGWVESPLLGRLGAIGILIQFMGVALLISFLADFLRLPKPLHMLLVFAWASTACWVPKRPREKA